MKRTVSLILALIFIAALAITAYAATAPGDTLVYRTASGKKYHTMTCSQLNGKESIEITLEEAVKKGLEPCSKCNPPTLASGSTEAAASSSSASAVTTGATSSAKSSGGFLSGVSPILTFFIGVVVGALVITYIRGMIIMKQEEAEAAAEAEAEEPEEK